MAIKDLIPVQKHLFLCNGGTCKLNGAEEATAVIRQAFCDAGLTDQTHTTKTLCNGRCKDGPIVIGMPEGIWYKQITPENAPRLVRAYIDTCQVPEELVLYRYGSDTICPVVSIPKLTEEIDR